MTLIKKLNSSNPVYIYTSWYLYLNACLTKGKHKQNSSTNLPLSLWLHNHSSWLSTFLQITLSCHHSAHSLYWCSICGKQICHLYWCSVYGKCIIMSKSLLVFYLWQIHVISTVVLSVANKHCETCCIYIRQSCSQFSSLISFYHSLLGFCCVIFFVISFIFFSLFLSL